MPDYTRTDVHFPLELSHKLELLRVEAEQSVGRHVSKSDLVVKIVELFFTKMRYTSLDETKTSLQEVVGEVKR